MEKYAAKWEMDWSPKIITRAEYGDFANKGTAPHGTASVYASIPHRKMLLREYDGLVFLDSDNVIVDSSYDICKSVNDEQPIATEPNCNAAVMVLKSCKKTIEMMDLIWDQRHAFKHFQWLEQAAYMELMGWDPKYPGDNQPPVWLGETEWTPLRADIDRRWGVSPFHPLPEVFSWHPGGVQPWERRIEMVRAWVAQAGTDPGYTAPTN
jgi:hypothetical protein